MDAKQNGRTESARAWTEWEHIETVFINFEVNMDKNVLM